ncbi:MAG: lipopolysaccharide kinase InaA family protein [Planctomycetota bacterium]|jgi:tRNA A-37 threonylcarbamoyl transferase component Bud32
MAEFPFQLLIKNTSSDNKEESLTCSALLRAIPGRREVYDALWNGRGVIVKVFSHKISAKRHLKREWRGLSLLQRRGLNSPEPLFTGRTEDGRWAVVVEKVADLSTVLDILNEIADKTQKLELLVLVCKEVAKQHSKGVLQKDLHFGNFLLGGDKVFALDVGQMQFFSRQISRKRSISQLASLVCYLAASDTESIAKLCREYFKARGWRFRKSDEALLQRQVTAHRKKGVRRGLKKCLRTSKRHLRIKSGGYLAVFDMDFCQGAEPLDFIEQIDGLMDRGRILKKGNTCYVSRVMWNDRDVVVKRYNHKGFIHSLRHTIKKSRAHRGWLHGHRLGMLSIATPKPLAYIEQRRGMLVWKSYLVTEYVEGQKLYDFLRDGNVTEQQRSARIEQVGELLDKLGRNRIAHGDLKHSNILLAENGAILTDLDGVKVYRWNWMFKVKRRKDLERFSKEIDCNNSLIESLLKKL